MSTRWPSSIDLSHRLGSMSVKVSRYLTRRKTVQLAAFRRHEVIMEKEASGPLVETPVLAAADPLPITNSLKVAPGVKPKAAKKVLPSRKVSALPNPGLPENGRSARSPKTALPPVHKGSAFIWPVRGNLISRFGKKGEGVEK